MFDEQQVFTEMVWGFSAAWALLVCGAVWLAARGKRLDHDLDEVRRQIPGGSAHSA